MVSGALEYGRARLRRQVGRNPPWEHADVGRHEHRLPVGEARLDGLLSATDFDLALRAGNRQQRPMIGGATRWDLAPCANWMPHHRNQGRQPPLCRLSRRPVADQHDARRRAVRQPDQHVSTWPVALQRCRPPRMPPCLLPCSGWGSRRGRRSSVAVRAVRDFLDQRTRQCRDAGLWPGRHAAGTDRHAQG